MEHHIIAYINAHMGRAGGVIGALEEHQITRSDIGGGHPRTELSQSLRAQPAEVPAHAAVVVDVADETGAVKRGRRGAAAPDIRETEILFRFFDDGGKLFILQRLRRNIVCLLYTSDAADE